MKSTFRRIMSNIPGLPAALFAELRAAVETEAQRRAPKILEQPDINAWLDSIQTLVGIRPSAIGAAMTTPIRPGEIPDAIVEQIVRDATQMAAQALHSRPSMPYPEDAARQIAEAGVLAWRIAAGRTACNCGMLVCSNCNPHGRGTAINPSGL